MKSELTFGQLLRGIRDEKGITQQALADASGLSRVEIARLETDVRAPSWETVKSLCRALGVGCDAFMTPTQGNPMPRRHSKAKRERKKP
jgi:transcriptional regulator with XRE-family HTH domain